MSAKCGSNAPHRSHLNPSNPKLEDSSGWCMGLKRPDNVNGHEFDCDPVMGQVWWCTKCGIDPDDEREDEQCTEDFPEPSDDMISAAANAESGQSRYERSWRESHELHR